MAKRKTTKIKAQDRESVGAPGVVHFDEKGKPRAKARAKRKSRAKRS